jgi:hypothetical protein
MNDKEKTEFYIAMCRCCLIAQVMKGCSKCRFKIGLNEQTVKTVIAIPIPAPSLFTRFEMSHQQD